MPIYTYRCTECAHTEDILQKISAAPLTQCPRCQQASFKKQLTAASFQLKGSGYYVTDFRDAGAESKNTPSSASITTESSQKALAKPTTAASAEATSSTATDTSVAATTKKIADAKPSSSATQVAGS